MRRLANKRILAFDFGASSGRAIMAEFDGEKISMEEIHRFTNDPVQIGNTLHWDVLRLFFEIKRGITKAVNAGGFDVIGMDTWGVDFGLLDKNGALLSNPVHYRDARTEGMMEKVFETIPKDELYRRTGIEIMRINTLFQLVALKEKQPELLERAETMLMIPDLFAYWLTGQKRAEITEASTSQCLDPATKEWNLPLLEELGLPTNILPPVIQPGTVYGTILPEICEELGCKPVPVVAVSTHDTASAIMAVPSHEENFIYISCGTWSLFGTELSAPILTDASAAGNLTNETGFAGTTCFLKNIMGLWLIQESRRQWIREGNEMSYAELEKLALAAKPLCSFVNPDDPSFEAPGNLPRRIQEYCKKTNQPVPETVGEIMRCIYQSIALKYRYSFDAIRRATGKEYPVIHMIGGGTKDRLLCQMTADACNTKVIAGPIEATATGNILAQLIALGEIPDMKAGRAVVMASEQCKEYTPQEPDAYQAVYADYCKLIDD